MKRKILLSLIVGVLALALTFGLVACGDQNGTSGAITLSTTSLTLNVGGSSGMVVATTTSGKTVTWSVDDATVVEIKAVNNSNLCTVKPLKEGTAVLTATLGEDKATCTITVGAAVEVETVTIYQNGTALADAADLTIERNGSLTLTASGSKGSTINWSSSNESVATVDNGVITAHVPGNTVITAYVTASIKATVNLTVTAPAGAEFYNLQYAAEGATQAEDGTAIVQDKYFYWSAQSKWGQQQVEVDYCYYDDGVLKFKYTCDTDTGYHYGFQLMRKNSDQTIGNAYKLTCTINVDQNCMINLNGNIIELQKGNNNVTAYYVYSDPLGSGETYGISSFDLVMGYEDGTLAGHFVQNAEVSVSNMKWENYTQPKLASPAFTYDAAANTVAITDTNAECVKGFLLNFYQNDALKSAVEVENGKKVDTSKIANGTYTVRLVTLASSAKYLNSDPSTSTATITVENEGGPSYTLTNGGATGAMQTPGIWYYWTESWVTFNGSYANGVVTAEFSNNTGNWYDTQLFYKDPSAEAGKTYDIVLTISSTSGGRVTVSGKVVTLESGTHDYTVTVTQSTTEATLTIVFGVYPESNQQEIQAATVTIAVKSMTESTGGSQGGQQGGNEQGEVPSEYNLTLKTEAQAAAAPGRWFYWASEWVTFSGNYKNGTVTATFSNNAGWWYDTQLFYRDSTATAGKTYEITLTINSPKAGKITICGTEVQLSQGTADYKVTVTQSTMATISIQFGLVDKNDGQQDIQSGTVTIAIKSMTETSGGSQGGNGGNEGGQQGGNEQGQTETEYTLEYKTEAQAVAAPGKWYYWASEWVTFSGNYKDDTVTATFSNNKGWWYDTQLFYRASDATVGKTYEITFTITAPKAGKITICGTEVQLSQGTADYTVTVTQSGGATVSIQFGLVDKNDGQQEIQEGTVTIKIKSIVEKN